MKVAAVVACSFFLAGAALVAGDKPALETEEAKTIYALGASIATNVRMLDLSEPELDLLVAGLRDMANGSSRVELKDYQAKIRTLATQRMRLAGERERVASNEWITEVAGRKSCEQLESGIVIREIKEGTGATPKATDRVGVHYKGTLRDGTEFDRSGKVDGTPAKLGVSGVISCWTEALQKMKVGGKIEVWCPADRAYGDRGSPPRIKPGAALKFEIELVEIVN